MTQNSLSHSVGAGSDHPQLEPPSSADAQDDSCRLFLYFIKMESSEETPLLLTAKNLDHEQVYKRFALSRKRGILAIVSLVGLIPRTSISLKLTLRMLS